mmetsp:Transcript_2917/g.18313  ORF Transcript_2917/g.18313 Transcript_2917/m.18313 type:complete len:210 (+) Transcript_2917:881-1510(+)
MPRPCGGYVDSSGGRNKVSLAHSKLRARFAHLNRGTAFVPSFLNPCGSKRNCQLYRTGMNLFGSSIKVQAQDHEARPWVPPPTLSSMEGGDERNAVSIAHSRIKGAVEFPIAVVEEHEYAWADPFVFGEHFRLLHELISNVRNHRSHGHVCFALFLDWHVRLYALLPPFDHQFQAASESQRHANVAATNPHRCSCLCRSQFAGEEAHQS